MRVQRAPAGVDEEDLVGVGVAEELVLGPLGPARRQSHVRVGEQGDPAGDRVAARGDGPCLQVMMAERRDVDQVARDRPGRLDFPHARRRAEVVDDAVRPREPGDGDDLFVVIPSPL